MKQFNLSPSIFRSIRNFRTGKFWNMLEKYYSISLSLSLCDGEEASLFDALAYSYKNTDTLRRPHLHFVIVFLFHQFVVGSKIDAHTNILKILNITCMRYIEQSICNIHLTGNASIRYDAQKKLYAYICAVIFVCAIKTVCLMYACVFRKQKSR